VRSPAPRLSHCPDRGELLGRYSKLQKPLIKHLPDASGNPRPSRPLVHAARRRLNPEERRQLAVDYKAGRSTTWLMRTYYLGKGTVLNILKEQGVRMRGQGVPDDRLQEAIDLYKSGWSLMRVGQHVGCSGETVRQALLATGIKLRRRWERM
jgi:hypothetical protein